ncbi:unnamed protein product [Amoebophrya sp. A120]|nr:unnamed protein product [Amoebophrya sp. A120]|eukprot:GSA120T00001009001.1
MSSFPLDTGAAPSSTARRPRVLCLHGNRQTASIFEERIKPLKRHADLFFLEGDFEWKTAPTSTSSERKVEQQLHLQQSGGSSEAAEQVDDASGVDEGTLSWVPCTTDGEASRTRELYASDGQHGSTSKDMKYDQTTPPEAFLPALKKVYRYWLTHGPFDGVLGFSQGAALAALVARRHQEFCPLLKFAVICGGYNPYHGPRERSAGSPKSTSTSSGVAGVALAVDDENKVKKENELMAARKSLISSGRIIPSTLTTVFHFIGARDKLVTPLMSRRLLPGRSCDRTSASSDSGSGFWRGVHELQLVDVKEPGDHGVERESGIEGGTSNGASEMMNKDHGENCAPDKNIAAVKRQEELEHVTVLHPGGHHVPLGHVEKEVFLSTSRKMTATSTPTTTTGRRRQLLITKEDLSFLKMEQVEDTAKGAPHITDSCTSKKNPVSTTTTEKQAELCREMKQMSVLQTWLENLALEKELLEATFDTDMDIKKDHQDQNNKECDEEDPRLPWIIEIPCGENFALEMWYPPGFANAEGDLDLDYVPPDNCKNAAASAIYNSRARPPAPACPLLQRMITHNFLLEARLPELEDVLAADGDLLNEVEDGATGPVLEVGYGVSLGLAAADWERVLLEENSAVKAVSAGVLAATTTTSQRQLQGEEQHQTQKDAGAQTRRTEASKAKEPSTKWWEQEGGVNDDELCINLDMMRRSYAEFLATHILNRNSSPRTTCSSTSTHIVSGERGNGRRGRIFEFVLGLVGKPSAGKSTFFNALVCDHEREVVDLVDVEGSASSRTDSEQDPTKMSKQGHSKRAAVASHPFTTIEPNIGEAWLRIHDEGVVDQMKINTDHDKNISSSTSSSAFHHQQQPHPPTTSTTSEHKIPFLVKDVAGLVPGAYQGKGRGNAFLNDLLRADALAHIVDISGRLDACGEVSNTNGDEEVSTVLHDIQFIREEIFAWIFTNVKAKWHGVYKYALVGQHDHGARGVSSKSDSLNSPALDRFVALFTGYHCTPDYVRNLWIAWATGRGPPPSTTASPAVELLNFADYQEEDLMHFVHFFVHHRFPMVLVCNKVDLLESAEVLQDRLEVIRKKFPEYSGNQIIPISGKARVNTKTAVKASFVAAAAIVLRLVLAKTWPSEGAHERGGGATVVQEAAAAHRAEEDSSTSPAARRSPSNNCKRPVLPDPAPAFFDLAGATRKNIEKSKIFFRPPERGIMQPNKTTSTQGIEKIDETETSAQRQTLDRSTKQGISSAAPSALYSYHLLPSNTTVFEAFEAVRREGIRVPTNSDFVRAEKVSNAKMSGSGRMRDLACSFSMTHEVWNAVPSMTDSVRSLSCLSCIRNSLATWSKLGDFIW